MKIINYGGYNATGASVVRDLLKECDDVITFPCEFRLLKDKNGLFDLRDSILNHPSPDYIDLAIRDFIFLTEKLGTIPSFWSGSGLSWNKFFHNRFFEITDQFVEAIVSYRYEMSWHYYEFRKSWVRLNYDRLIRRVRGIPMREHNKKLAYTSFVDDGYFDEMAKCYIRRLIDEFASNSGLQAVALHNAIPPYTNKQVELGLKYQGKAKLAIIDRDPLDVFANLHLYSFERYLDVRKSPDHLAESFLLFYKRTRANKGLILKNPNVIEMRFEDFCLDYDDSRRQIFEFFEIDLNMHVRPLSIFDPSISKQRIGIWKNLPKNYRAACELIEKGLAA